MFEGGLFVGEEAGGGFGEFSFGDGGDGRLG